MVDSMPWVNKECVKCGNSLIMPDSSLYCRFTMKPAKGRCEEYSFGKPKLYEPGKYKVRIEKRAVKKKVVKPKPRTTRSTKKIRPEAPRLF